jgi:hypothetical protein
MTNNRKLERLILAISLLGAACSSAMADQTVRICIGQYEKICRAETRADAWFPCGVPVETAGRQVCTVYTSTGAVIKPFRILRVSDEGGNQCGYAVFTVICLDQAQPSLPPSVGQPPPLSTSPAPANPSE